MKTQRLRFNILLIFIGSLLISIFYIGLLIHLIIAEPERLTSSGFIFISIIFIIFLGPPTILTITYFIEDFNKTLEFNLSSGEIIINKNKNCWIINKDSILDFYIVKVDKYTFVRYQFPQYQYVLIILKDGDRIFITNLLSKPQRLIDFLKIIPHEINVLVPFIDRRIGEINLTPDKYEKKVKEFYHTFNIKTNSELIEICSQQAVYADYAREAARRLLKEREK